MKICKVKFKYNFVTQVYEMSEYKACILLFINWLYSRELFLCLEDQVVRNSNMDDPQIANTDDRPKLGRYIVDMCSRFYLNHSFRSCITLKKQIVLYNEYKITSSFHLQAIWMTKTVVSNKWNVVWPYRLVYLYSSLISLIGKKTEGRKSIIRFHQFWLSSHLFTVTTGKLLVRWCHLCKVWK
jgi:hypothetical protein